MMLNRMRFRPGLFLSPWRLPLPPLRLAGMYANQPPGRKQDLEPSHTRRRGWAPGGALLFRVMVFDPGNAVGRAC